VQVNLGPRPSGRTPVAPGSKSTVRGYPAPGDESIPVNEASDPIRKPVSNTGDDHTAIAVARENHVLDVVLDP
jgi:hypothetical protein